MSDRLQHIHDELARRKASWQRKWRRVRWSVRILVGVPLILGLIALVLMRSPVVGWLLSSKVRQITGCELRAGGAYITLNGSLALRDFALVAPGVKGDAAEFISAPRAWLDLDWSGLFSGSVRPTSLRLLNPTVLFSQNADDGTINIASLAAMRPAPAPSGTPGEPEPAMTLPTINVIDGTIVVAEHDAAGKLRILKSLPVAGAFSPTGRDKSVYVISLQEIGRRGMLLEGRIDLDTSASSVKLNNLSFDDWAAESVPSAYRELWRALNIQGDIASTALEYDKAQGPRVSVILSDVSMNALIPTDAASPALAANNTPPTPPAPPAQLKLTRVKGKVAFSLAGLAAELEGVIEGQRGVSKVKLTTQGLSASSALTCEISAKRFDLTKDPEFLPYVPERAREYFQIFSGPTGEIDVRLVISRAAPNSDGSPASVQVSGGRVGIRNGTAAFHRFPYPFTDIDALCEFDDNSVKIVSLEGKGLSGARMRATGLITPLDETAMIDVQVHADNVPVDDHLLRAMPKERKDLFNRLFHRPSYERLVRLGLIRPLGMPNPITSAEANLAPEFVLAGPADVDVHVYSPPGKDAPWFTTVDIAFAQAGVLLEAFPLPVIAENVKIRVTDDDAKVLAGTFRGLSGGTAELTTSVVFRENNQPVLKPDIRVVAKDIPIDELLLHTLPGGELASQSEKPAADARSRQGATTEQSLSAGRLVRALGARGTLDAVALVTAPINPRPVSPDEDGPNVDYQVDITLNNVIASPSPNHEPSAFILQDLSGKLHLTRERLEVSALKAGLFRSLAADALRPDQPSRVGTLLIDADVALSGAPYEKRRALRAVVDADALDVREPIEQLVAIFAPEGASRLAETRSRFQPSGSLHARLVALRHPGDTESTAISLRLQEARDLSFNALAGRVNVQWLSGGVTLDIPADDRLTVGFDAAKLRVGFDDANCGDLLLQGSFALDPNARAPIAPANFTAELTAWKLESPLVTNLLKRLASEDTASSYNVFKPEGLTDATLLLRSLDPARPANPEALALSLELRPSLLSITRRETRVGPARVSGAVTLATTIARSPDADNRPVTIDPVAGELQSLMLVTDNWSATLAGRWSLDEQQRLLIDTRLDADVTRIDSALGALLPAGASKVLTDLEAKFQSPIQMRGASLKLSPARSVEHPSLSDAPAVVFDGTLSFTDLSFNIGLAVDRVHGSFRIQADDPGGVADAQFQVLALADSLRISGITMQDARATIQSGNELGEILVPELSAHAHGGLVSGAARATTPKGDAPGSFDLDLRVAGIRLAPVLADFADSGVTQEAPMGPPDLRTEPDPSRGVVDARVYLSGVPGAPDKRTGYGAIRVADGDVLQLPVILPLIQLSNLQLPSKDRLSLVETTLQVQGRKVLFDSVDVRSRSIEILGAGTLMLPELTLDMSFNSRGSTRFPVLSSIFEALRNEIVTTKVTGKLSDPKIKSEPLMGTRTMLSEIFDPSSRPRFDPVLSSKALEAKRELQRQASASAEQAPPAR